MTDGKYLIRDFDPGRDADAVIRCYESGFGPTLGPLFEYSERAALEDMVMTDHGSASFGMVAEAGGEARGLLFGSFPSGWTGDVRHGFMSATFMLRRFVTRRREMQPLARAVLWRAVIHELEYYRHGISGNAAHVQTLASQEGWRGGIGRALMDAFLESARSRGIEKVQVATDSELNWGFYERYGFRRTVEWPYHAYDYTLPGKDVRAYIYSLDI